MPCHSPSALRCPRSDTSPRVSDEQAGSQSYIPPDPKAIGCPRMRLRRAISAHSPVDRAPYGRDACGAAPCRVLPNGRPCAGCRPRRAFLHLSYSYGAHLLVDVILPKLLGEGHELALDIGGLLRLQLRRGADGRQDHDRRHKAESRVRGRRQKPGEWQDCLPEGLSSVDPASTILPPARC